MQRLLGIAILALVGSAGTSHASTVLDGNFAISYAVGVGNAPSFGRVLGSFNSSTDKGSFSNEAVPLSETGFFDVSPAGSCGYLCGKADTASGTITLTFSSLELIVGTNTYTETGGPYQATATYMANYKNDTDSVTWSSSVIPVTFSNGEVVDITLYNASDWTIDPEISFKVVSQTPLPAALPLFAGGLGVMSLLGLRRKRKATRSAL